VLAEFCRREIRVGVVCDCGWEIRDVFKAYELSSGGSTGPVVIRARADTDLDACEQVARAVHLLDGYPAYLRDMRSFLVSADALCAWVMEEDDAVVGHVALHRRSFEAVMATASAFLGIPREQIGVVARLFVAPGHRGKGFGRALLATASQAARSQGLWPVLDVSTRYRRAIELYVSNGWTCAGPVVFRAPDGRVFDELVYIGPPEDEAPPQSGGPAPRL
jgi:GNAT superfamily N-acetyltransferase